MELHINARAKKTYHNTIIENERYVITSITPSKKACEVKGITGFWPLELFEFLPTYFAYGTFPPTVGESLFRFYKFSESGRWERVTVSSPITSVLVTGPQNYVVETEDAIYMYRAV